MPNDVREMTDEELLGGVGKIGEQLTYALEISRRLKVMRELCEAVDDRSLNSAPEWDYERWKRVNDALDAYRAMKSDQILSAQLAPEKETTNP